KLEISGRRWRSRAYTSYQRACHKARTAPARTPSFQYVIHIFLPLNPRRRAASADAPQLPPSAALSWRNGQLHVATQTAGAKAPASGVLNSRTRSTPSARRVTGLPSETSLPSPVSDTSRKRTVLPDGLPRKIMLMSLPL